jgi:hypothetical protein
MSLFFILAIIRSIVLYICTINLDEKCLYLYAHKSDPLYVSKVIGQLIWFVYQEMPMFVSLIIDWKDQLIWFMYRYKTLFHKFSGVWLCLFILAIIFVLSFIWFVCHTICKTSYDIWLHPFYKVQLFRNFWWP